LLPMATCIGDEVLNYVVRLCLFLFGRTARPANESHGLRLGLPKFCVFVVRDIMFRDDEVNFIP
jgi:hypothetical protein